MDNDIVYSIWKHIAGVITGNKLTTYSEYNEMGKCIYGKSIIKFNKGNIEIGKLIDLSFKDKIVNFLENILIKLT